MKTQEQWAEEERRLNDNWHLLRRIGQEIAYQSRDPLYRTGALIFFGVLTALSLVGCSTQIGLFNPSVKKICTGWYCYLTAPKDLVNTRCVDRKSAWKICKDNPNRPECAGAVAQWDDGTPRTGPNSDPNKRARCCTVLRPKSADDRLRYWIWVGEGDDVCVAHEHGHIEIYEKDGFKYVEANHRRLHGFGLDKEKKRL